MQGFRLRAWILPFSKFSGVLFPNMSVTTNAAEGYRFIGWKDQQGKWLTDEKECHFGNDGTYTAVYDNTFPESLSPICINEVSAANDIYVNEYGKRADWIELYNRGQEPLDVSQWFFSDEEQNPTKYQIDAAKGVSTIIRPNGHLVIWCDGKSSVSEPHLPFKLKNADNSTLILQSADGRWKDSMSYKTHSSKETVGRYPDGGSNSWTFYHPTIGTPNMVTIYDNIVVSTSFKDNVKVEQLKKGSIYNLAGQRINLLQKGLNIVDGKKIYVK